MRRAVVASLPVLAAVAAAAACASSGSTGPTPVPSVASSPVAAAAFEAIRDAWRDPEHTTPAALRGMLERFLATYPLDGRAPLAHVYLALVAMAEDDLATADRELALGESLPPGSTRDLWTVARARRLRLSGEPDAAMQLLRPLVGKTVDPIARDVFEEELTLSALATHSDYEAISYMDAWLRASSDEDKARTVAAVTAIVEHLPRDVLVNALEAMRTQRASFGYGVEIERILAQRLVKIATSSGDAALARMLLDEKAGAIVVGGDAGVALGELATSRRGLNVVEGRTIGLLLPTESPGLRDEAADVLRGVMWALGLPRGVRTAAATPPAPDAGTSAATKPSSSAATLAAARASCAPPEPAPPLDEPDPQERVKLVTRDDAGTADRTEVSLDELAGEGAAIVIAALDPDTAARALRWGENHAVPVVTLAPPDQPTGGSAFGFVAGESRAAVVEALARAAPALTGGAVEPVIDTSELALYPPGGGRVAGLTLLPPVSCDIPATRAGDPRFPLAQWEKDRTSAWLVSGSPGCARDLVGELAAAHDRGVVAMTLEAAALPARPPGLRVLTASAGVVPDAAAAGARDDELGRFRATLGTVSWWTALGRDAATLARIAARQLPTDSVSDPAAVADRRARARDLLAAARARLWSTETAGWTAEHTLKRTVCAVDAR